MHLYTKTTSRQTKTNGKGKEQRQRLERNKGNLKRAKAKTKGKDLKRPKFCDFAGTLKKTFYFWLSKAQNLRGLCNIQTEQIKGVAGLKMALFALICTRFLLQVKRRAFWTFQAGRIKGGKGPAGFSPDTNGGGYWNGGGQRHYKSGGEGVSNQNGKAGVASKKISVQNPQNHFGYQNVLVSKKFSEKISGKVKRGLYLKVEFLGRVAKICRGLYFLIVTICRFY